MTEHTILQAGVMSLGTWMEHMVIPVDLIDTSSSFWLDEEHSQNSEKNTEK